MIGGIENPNQLQHDVPDRDFGVYRPQRDPRVVESVKNELCTVVPHPDDTLDWARTTMENALNSIKWNADPGLKTWLSNARLDGFSGRGAPRQAAGPSGDDLLGRIREVTPSALEKLAAYLDEGRKVN